MRAIRSKDMRPELAVRSLVHKMGYRYRLHKKDLPGKPDLVFASRRKVIFVHGCFWHSHHGCNAAHVPKSNQDYWGPKLRRNQSRDRRNIKNLVIASAIIVAARLAREDIGRPSPRITAAISESVSLARWLLGAVLRRYPRSG